VDTETQLSGAHKTQAVRFRPFDPVVDTEIEMAAITTSGQKQVFDPSIQSWILKSGLDRLSAQLEPGFRPFDPVVDTETFLAA